MINDNPPYPMPNSAITKLSKFPKAFSKSTKVFIYLNVFGDIYIPSFEFQIYGDPIKSFLINKLILLKIFLFFSLMKS